MQHETSVIQLSKAMKTTQGKKHEERTLQKPNKTQAREQEIQRSR